MPHLAEPLPVQFDYIDADGIETRRTIDVYRTAKRSGYTLITGFCHGRQAERSFRSDRLQTVTTMDGEVISGAEFVARINAGWTETVQMTPISEPPARAISEPPPRSITAQPPRRPIWPKVLLWLAMAPGLIIATILLTEGDIGPAGLGLVMFCGPVLAVRWAYRRWRAR